MGRRFYRFCCAVARPFYSLFYPADMQGLENVPREGGALLCANHCSNRDPFYLALRVRDRYLHFMAKIELFKFKPLAMLMNALMAFPVDRGHNDLNAVRTSLKLLSEGHILGVFPQGTRSKDNSRLPTLNGVAMIALRAQKPVIPVYIDGPYKLFRKNAVRFGKPVDLSDIGKRMDGETLKEVTRRIEDAVWGLKG